MLQLTDPVHSFDTMVPFTQTLCAIFAARPSLRRLHVQAILGPRAQKGRRTELGVLLVSFGGKTSLKCGLSAAVVGRGHHYSQTCGGWG